MRRRRLVAGLVALATIAIALGLIVGTGGSSSPSAAKSRPQLPRGGRKLLPRYRLVAFYGAPQSADLGTLGIGTPRQAGERLAKQAKAYSGRHPIMPVFELLVSVAASDPGDDGDYRLREPRSVIDSYLAQARRQHGLLLLDIQPGRAEFASEIRRLRPYLRLPNVGLALDPEWHVGPAQIPGQDLGSVTAKEVNQISGELAGMVKRRDLPEKLFVIHQFTESMIIGRSHLADRRGLATVVNVDGFGDPPNKIAKYHSLRPLPGDDFYSGFKLFYQEDTGLMSPSQVLGLRPAPVLIVYE